MSVSLRSTRVRAVALALTAALLLAVGIVPALARPVGGGTPGIRDWLSRAVRALTQRERETMLMPGDTTVVYGPLRVTSPSGSQTLGVERFTAVVSTGRQYLLEVARGDESGGGLPATIAVRLNGSAIASETDFAGGVNRLTRVVALTPVDTVTLAVSGSAGATAQVRVLEIADPTVLVYGPQEFLRGTGQPETETVHFTFDGRGGPPYRMCILNGLADGTKRTSSATITLNGQTIATQSDVNQQVGSLTRTVPLVVGDNVLQVYVASVPTSRISLCVTAADITPPVLTIAAPPVAHITRDATIAVSGTVSDQTATRVTVNGAETVRSGDAWSATAVLSSEGTKTITVHAVDAAGNATDSVRTVIRDSEAPVIALTSPGAEQTLTRADSVDVAGQVTDRTTVTLTVNGTATVVGTDGHFATRIALAAGANFVLVSATDQAGNNSTVTRQVTRDDVPPAIAWAAPTDAAIVKTTSIAVTGTVTDQSAITLTLNNTPVTLTPATGGSTPGTFQTSFALAADGPVTLTLLATDAAGNTSTLSRTITRDATPPVIVVQQPAAGLVTNAETVHVAGTVTDLTATTLTVGTTTLPLAADGSFAGDIPLVAGSNTLAFVATDAAGNVANVDRVVVQDRTPPVLTLLGPAADTLTSSATMRIHGRVHDATAITLTVNGAAVPVAADSTFETEVALANEGALSYAIVAVDAAGNQTQTSATIVRDVTPPVVAVLAPAAGGVTRELTTAVSGTVADAHAVRVTVNGVSMQVADGTFSGVVPLDVEGANTLVATATDAAGNGASASTTTTRDTQAPVVTVESPASGTITPASSVIVRGHVTDATPTTLTVGGVAVAPGTDGSFETSVALVSGANTIDLLATDAAGNTSTLSRTITRDATPPVIVVQQPAAGLVTSAETVHAIGTVTDLTATTLTVGGTAVALGADGSFAADVPLVAGSNSIAFVATDAAGNVANAERVVVQDRTPPVVAITAPSDNVLTRTVTVTVRGTIADASAVTATLNDTPLVLAADRSYQTTIALSEGVNLLTVVATDAAGNASTATHSITLDTTAPALAVTAPAEGATTTNESTTVTGTATDASVLHVTVKGAEVTLATGGAFSTTVALVLGSNSIDVVATDAAGNSTTVSRAVTRETGIDPTLPPNPSTIAPKLNRTVATTQAAATAFLYSGSNPVQVGVVPGAISAVQASTLRGRVITTAGAPLPGATVTVLGHPELGTTKSRVDGWYDLVANGGGVLTVTFAKDGYLGAQRNVRAPSQDYTRVPDVALVKPDTAVTVVQLGAGSDAQVARASTVSDVDGTRRATFIFDAGTSATITLPDGTTQPASALSIRVTEYTVGPNGKAAMPAPLPATSGYTYAAAPTADEAVAVGGTVTFSKPVSAYVENFLGFAAGTKVPLGTYDATAANWQAQPDGRVVKVLSVDNGIATVDANGDGVADDATLLTANGFSDAELQRLAVTYQPGATLMRTRLFGLYPFDANLPFKALGVDPVVVAAPGCASATRDIVKCDVRNATQAVAVPGTALTLNYTSARSVAAADRTLDIPITGNVMPAGLKGMYVHVTVAGQTTEMQWLPAPNVTYHYVWDGNDAYGRPVQGNPTAVVEIGHLFPAEYQFPAEVARSFGLTCSQPPVNGQQMCQTVQNQGAEFSERHSFWRVSTAMTKLGGLDAKAQGLGGFDFNVHHQYDPMGRVLYLGDGSTRIADAMSATITTVAGSGTSDYATGDGGPATKAKLAYTALQGIAALPDGRILAPNAGYLRIVGTDGIISRFAGWARPIHDYYGNDAIWMPNGRVVGENGLKDSTFLNYPAHPAIGADGTIYLADNGWSGIRILRITPDGRMTRVAGNHTGVPIAEGVHASAAALGGINQLAVDASNNLYFVSSSAPTRVFRLGADSLLHVVAGNGQDKLPVEGGLAASEGLRPISALAVGPDGSLYIGTNDIYYYNGFQRRLLRVTPDGVIRTFAGGGSKGVWETFDRLQMNFVWGINAIVVSNDNVVYFNDGNVTMMAQQDGRLNMVAGVGNGGFGGDGGPALKATFNGISGLALASDGTLLIADYWNARIRRMAVSMPGFAGGTFVVASADGTELYSFDASGRHLSTLNARTGKPKLTFGYASGLLISVTENGKTTTIERDANGVATAIVGAGGIRTTLQMDGTLGLRQIATIDGDSVAVQMTADGLLTTLTNAAGNAVVASRYNADGRLAGLTDAGGTGLSMTSSTAGDASTASVTSADGVVQSIVYQQLPGVRRTTTKLYSQAVVSAVETADGQRTLITPDGVQTISNLSGDPRYGMEAPVIETIVRMPSGLVRSKRDRRGVEGEDPTNIFDIFAQIDSADVNGRVTITRTDRSEAAVRRTTPEGRVSTLEYDGQGRTTDITLPGLAPIARSFDEAGRIGAIAIGSRVTGYEYDSYDRIMAITKPLGLTESVAYYGSGRVATHTLAGGRSIRFTYDAGGHLASLTPNGEGTSVVHQDSAGRLTYFKAPDVGDGAAPLTFEFDAAGRLGRQAFPDGSQSVASYSSSSPDFLVVTSRGDSINHHFDPTSLTLRSSSYNRGASLSFTYDGSLLRNEAWNGLGKGSVDYVYDPDFRIREERVNGANLAAFTYDRDGLVTTAGALTVTRAPGSSLLSSLTLGNTSTRLYHNTMGELDSTATTVNGQRIYSARFVVDDAGRITSKVETVDAQQASYAFAYDSASQLSDVTRDGQLAEHFEFDAQGNRVRVVTNASIASAVVGANNRLLSIDGAQFAYDQNGRVSRRVVGTDTTTYSYSVTGQLESVRLPRGTSIGYMTDAKERRVARTENGTVTARWLYRGDRTVIAELDAAGVVRSRFVYLPNVATPVYMTQGSATYRLVADERGSVRLVIDATTGAIVQQIAYDAYGRVTSNSNPGFQPFGFAGGLYDASTELTHFAARDYDASTGRWLTIDPALYDGGDLNLYRYAAADPVNLVDRGGASVFASEMLNDQAELEKLEGDASEAAMQQRKRLFERLCHNGGNILARFDEVEKVTGFDRHHIMQNADMLGLAGYTRAAGIAMPVLRSQHWLMNEIQGRLRGYYSPDFIARAALRAIGCSEADVDRIMDAMKDIVGDAYPLP